MTYTQLRRSLTRLGRTALLPSLLALAGCATPSLGDPGSDGGGPGSGDFATAGSDASARDLASRDSAPADQGTRDLASSGDLSAPRDLTPPDDLTPPPDLTSCLALPGACSAPLCIIACASCNKIGVCVSNACTCL